MYHTLANNLKRPALWERTPAPFWDDEHISKGMLEAHLNPDWDAASRKRETIDRTVRWLSGLLPANAQLLDLGCGPGLYTRPLAELTYRVVGIDFSRRSIAYARAHDPRSEYRYQNYLALDERERYDAITLIYCDYAALTPPERAGLLARVRQALRPGGLFVLDVFSDVWAARKKEETSWGVCADGGFWSARPYVCLDATYLYENGAVSADVHVVLTEETAARYIVWDTCYSREGLSDELRAGGLSVRAIFDDTCGSPYTGTSDTLCAVAVKE